MEFDIHARQQETEYQLLMIDTRAIGSMFFMGWEGTEVTPQIRTLIEVHHLGAILLGTKNLRSMRLNHVISVLL